MSLGTSTNAARTLHWWLLAAPSTPSTFQSRATTHDVDFFCRQLSQPHLGNLRDAGQYAVGRSSAPLSYNWLNNETARMPGVVENIDSLVEAAIAQNAVLCNQPGLRVVAALWNYAFIKKVSRITQGTGRSCDTYDAVAYLHQYITTTNRNQPVTFNRIQDWGRRYKALCPVEIIRQIAELYHRTYGRDGIAFSESSAARGGTRTGPGRR